MSIHLEHGYRLAPGTPVPEFTETVRSVMDPIRDDLDATVYAELLAATFDDHHRTGDPYMVSLTADARTKFTDFVNVGQPGQVWNDPHSFAFNIDTAAADPDGYRYLLLECQRDAYRDAWEALPMVTGYDYTTATDEYRTRGISDTAWAQRRADWAWLLDARRISDVTIRWDLRPDAEPNWDHVTNPDVVLAHLPSKTARARDRAKDQAAAEHFGARLTTLMRPGGLTIGEFTNYLAKSPRIDVLADQIAATLPDLTAATLTD